MSPSSTPRSYGRAARASVGAWALAFLGYASCASLGSTAWAQDAGVASAPPADAPRDEAGAAADRVHERGAYPDDISVPLDQSGAEGSGSGGIDMSGAGGGARPRVSLGPEPELGGDPADASWITRILRAIGEIFASLFGTLAEPIGWLMVVVGGVALLALVVYLITRIGLSFAAQKPASATGATDGTSPDAIDPLLVGPSMSAEDLAAQGRFGEAIHALFVTSLIRATGPAEGRKRGRTARELVERVPRQAAGAEQLGVLLGMTELVWFGGREAGADAYQHARTLAAAVTARVEAGDDA